uniref:Diaminopimelate epimerase n=1 Tax=Anthurium amnicola TaxID=1678845 RepID=A0A1D1XPQ0_9ARAE
MDQKHKPIYAEASGNTFLIFDYLDKYEHDFDEDIVRQHHKSYGFEKIDSCLVLTKVNNEEHIPTQLRGLNSVLLMRMYVYEPGDGFCGNGARAVSKYCFHHYRKLYNQFFIATDGWLHELLERSEQDLERSEQDEQDAEYLVEMGESVYHDPVGGFVEKGILDGEGKFIHSNVTWHYVNTSEPHLVTFDKIDNKELIRIGNSFNQEPNKFSIGINLNRVLIIDKSTINVLTFERGINRLTMACGSGSTSCAALAKRLGFIDQAESKVTVKVRGGYIIITSENGKVYLSGPCLVEGIDNVEKEVSM